MGKYPLDNYSLDGAADSVSFLMEGETGSVTDSLAVAPVGAVDSVERSVEASLDGTSVRGSVVESEDEVVDSVTDSGKWAKYLE